jgi:hypothetical protein
VRSERVTTKAQIDREWNMTTDERCALGAVEVVMGKPHAETGIVWNRYFYTYADSLGRREYIDYSPTLGQGQGYFANPAEMDSQRERLG